MWDVFLSGKQTVRWRVTAPKWLTVSSRQGTLTAATGQQQQRLQVRVAWRKLPRRGEATGFLTITGAGKTYRVAVHAAAELAKGLADYRGFLETNGYVSLFASHYSRKTDLPNQHWTLVEGVGRAGNALQAQPLQAMPLAIGTAPNAAAVVEYDFYTFTPAAPTVHVFTLPTHPTTPAASVRYGIAIDNGPMQVLDCRTVGRSEEWKQNVLSNSAQRQFMAPQLSPGPHTLKLYPLDPGVLLDRITIDLGGLQPSYGTIPETRWPATMKQGR